jgi:dipeptidyl aminopeptidase/acylaminoacyl peptidase
MTPRLRRRTRIGRIATIFAMIVCAAFVPAAAADEARRFALDDLEQMVRVSQPQISPDGRSIAVVVSRPNFVDNRHESELVLIDVKSGGQHPLTFERREVGQPRWSPDGSRLAFLAPHGEGDEKRMQVFIMPMRGGDARRLTDAPAGVQQYAWSPNGADVAYVTGDEEEKDKEAPGKYLDAFEVGDDHYLTEGPVLPAHIWLIPSGGGEARRLTSGSWSLPMVQPPGPPSSPLSWSPDGREIAFVRQEKPNFGNWDQTRVQVVEVATGTIRSLTGAAAGESVPSFSPDGAHIAYWLPRDGDWANVMEVYLAPAAGGAGRSLTRAIDRSLWQSLWMPDGRSLLVGGNDGTRVSLWLQPLEGNARRLDLGDVHPSWSFWIDAAVGRDGAIAFTGSTPQRPVELYHMASSMAKPRRLTDFNEHVAALRLGKVETIAWDGPDGFRGNGILIYPPGFDANRRHPLVLVIHGGPQAASTESFSQLGQLIAARGYVVFQPNYRGSDNLGNAYQRAIVNDSGAGPGRDVMAGIEAVKARGFVDESRIAVSGWSYGGYMTSWLIGNYPVWKAAVAGAAVTDLFDSYSLSDFNVSLKWWMDGSPWVDGNDAEYRAQSPLTYAHRATAPTLILATTGDVRVPTSQSYKLYHALRDNGVPVKFVAWPVGGHYPADPVRAQDVARRWIGWLDQHLGEGEATGAAAQ